MDNKKDNLRFLKDYKVACKCDSPATSGQLRLKTVVKGSKTVLELNLIEGPSCDLCGKAWEAIYG